jgi:hypothetical protein
MRKKNVAYLTNPADRDAVCGLMMVHKLTGSTTRELQELFGISRATVFGGSRMPEAGDFTFCHRRSLLLASSPRR